VVARRRDERRPTGRRRLREVAAIATALLVVPIAAILGLKLPLDAAGVLAPIFDLPRTAFGHVRSASEGPRLLGKLPTLRVREDHALTPASLKVTPLR